MSLKVWLPLDGNIRNQGVSNITVTNNGATVNTNGKIGSCYDFSSSAWQRIVFPYNLSNATEFSICLWHKPISTSISGVLFTFSRTSGNYWQFTIYQNNLTLRDSSTGVTGTRKNYSLGTFIANQWVHLTFTYNRGTIKIYKDGSLFSTNNTGGTSMCSYDGTTAGIGEALTNNSSYYIGGSINDFRIYDHCLSAAEVHEISQGLILHYKLDKPANINNNLYVGSEKFTGSWGGSGSWTTSTETYQNFVVKQRSGTWGGLHQNIPCTNGDIFTISFYAKVDSGGQIMSIHRSSLGNVTTGLTILGGNFSSGTNWITTTQNGTQWNRYWATVQITSTDITYLQWRIENNQSGKNLYICGMKLEKGTVATPWSPAASEAGETNIIQDSSGYGHNGTIVNTPSLINSQARYTSNIHFSANNQHIQLPAITYSNFGNSFTIAWWGRRSTHSNMMFWGFSNGNRLNGMYNGTLWNTGDGSNNPIYKPGTTTTITAPTAALWHHYVMVGNGTKGQLYVDGILYGEAKTYKGLTGTSIWINGWRNHTEYSSADMDISDFRIYCTALSAADIKQLYEVGAKIDNKQNLHTFELLEEQPQIKITKRGQIFSTSIEEISTTKFYHNKIIETNNLIEF